MSDSATEATTVEMTKEEFETWEREIQLGLRTTLPNGQTSDESADAESDLPEGFPGRDALISAGFGNLEQVAKFTFEDLTEIKNIGEKTAQAILDYWK